MDTVTALTTTTKQPYTTNTLTDNTSTHITTSINELRSFSTALSAFISSYDELNTHINIINSSIDDAIVSIRNPSGSESNCDRTVNDVTEGVVLVRSPRGRVSECEVRHAVEKTAANDGFRRGFDEIEALEKADVSKSCEEVEMQEETVPETYKVADVSKNTEEVDVFENAVEINALKKLEAADLTNSSKEIDVETVPETCCDETMSVVPEMVVSEMDELVAKKVEETDILIKPEQIDIRKSLEETVVLKKHEEFDTSMIHEEIVALKKLEESSCDQTIASVSEQNTNTSKEHEENVTCTKAKEPEVSNNSVVSKLERLCQSMCSKGMKWHIATHYSEMINLREEVAKALKLAKDPAKLVLKSIGQFFVQNSKTFRKPDRDTQNLTRMAVVLILECFLMISSDNGIEIANRERVDAAAAAVKWRKRMMTEGGPGHTDAVDARGLLLLISGFGIQDQVFMIQDIVDLIRASNVKGISTALRRSVFLIPKIPEVIDLMVKNNLEVEAADVAHAFGLEDKCHPQSILGTFLRNDIRNIQDGFSFQMKPEEIDTSKKHEEIGTCTKAKKPKVSKKSMLSVLRLLCRRMKSKGMKKHITKHYSEMINLRGEIANALKLAKNPAKLVLNSVCRFSVQGSKRFCMPPVPRQKKENAGSLVDVLILECFVTISSDVNEIAKKDQEYAAEAAIGWRKRMMTEGGPGHTDEVDARGLLLLISGFGIQDHVFKIQDIMDLIRASNVKGISAALRRSVFLMPKIPEVIDLMVKNNLQVEAADVAHAFGLEDKCHPQSIPGTFLYNDITNIQDGSSFQTKPEEIDTTKKHEQISTSTKTKEPNASKNSVVSKLENLCRGMCSKDMKWHVAKHYSEMINNREEIAKALKLAKDPAKLVLDSIGRFFVQGSRTLRNPTNPHQHEQNLARMAAVLILECFVMISNDDGVEIAKGDQDCAAKAAVDWRKRMIREGGPGHTDEVDARGLLLLISGFGIQNHVFEIKDIMDLIRASNVKGIATALRRSVFLVPKIPEVIDSMVKKNLEIEAADIAYTFGLEDKCHPENILVSFLHKKIKDIRNGSSFQMSKVMKQHLIDLKSVKQCLESHNIDPSMHLPNLRINEQIQNLEKKINEGRLIQKRKSLESPIHKGAKRACVSHHSMPHQHNPIDHYSMNRFIRPTRLSTSYLDSDRNPGNSYITNHSTSSVYDAPATTMAENLTDLVPNGLTFGFYGHDQMVHQSYSRYGVDVTLYSRHGETYDLQSYDRPHERSQPELFQGVPPLGGFSGRRGPSSNLYGFVDIVEKETRGFMGSNNA